MNPVCFIFNNTLSLLSLVSQNGAFFYKCYIQFFKRIISQNESYKKSVHNNFSKKAKKIKKLSQKESETFCSHNLNQFYLYFFLIYSPAFVWLN